MSAQNRDRETAAKLESKFQEAVGDLPDPVNAEAIDRILSEPMQETLLEAIAADAVDVVPIIGDLTALSRQEMAEEKGMKYPERPAVIENAISDLPPPLATIGDIIVAQNVISYLQREKGVPAQSLAEAPAAVSTDTYQGAIDAVLAPFRD